MLVDPANQIAIMPSFPGLCSCWCSLGIWLAFIVVALVIVVAFFWFVVFFVVVLVVVVVFVLPGSVVLVSPAFQFACVPFSPGCVIVVFVFCVVVVVVLLLLKLSLLFLRW